MAGKEPEALQAAWQAVRGVARKLRSLGRRSLLTQHRCSLWGGAGDFSKRNRARLTIPHFLEVWHHQDSVKPTQTQTRPGNWTRLFPCLLAAFSSLTHTAMSLVSYLRISQIAFFHWLPFPNVLSHCSVAGPESQMRCWHTKTVPVYKHVLPRLAAHPQKTAAKNLTLLLLILFLFFQI